jgi:hypothetical protein
MERPASQKSDARNARTHSRRQIRQIADSIAALVYEGRVVIAGHGRYAAKAAWP